MRAVEGDEITVKGPVPGAPSRRGEIVEVVEVVGEGEPRNYRVRWDDGHESIFFPGADSQVVSTH